LPAQFGTWGRIETSGHGERANALVEIKDALAAMS